MENKQPQPTNLAEIWQNYFSAMLNCIGCTCEEFGGVIKINQYVGGRLERDFARRTLIHRLFMQSDLFGEKECMVELLDANGMQEIPVKELTHSEITALCKAIDKATKENK